MTVSCSNRMEISEKCKTKEILKEKHACKCLENTQASQVKTWEIPAVGVAVLHWCCSVLLQIAAGGKGAWALRHYMRYCTMYVERVAALLFT